MLQSGRLSLLPDQIQGYGKVRLFNPADLTTRSRIQRKTPPRDHKNKVLVDLDRVFDACGIRDGAVLSFHHHLRNGDGVLNLVLAAAARRGLRDLTVAASSIFPVHAPLADHMRNGVVTSLWADYVRGPVGDAIMQGALHRPLILQSHGGRARAICSGELRIEVAFVGAPAADSAGNATGATGRAACGPLGYPMVDADHAARVVVVTDQLTDIPVDHPEIAADRVDHVVVVDSIGDPAGIGSGTTRPARDAESLAIARLAAEAVAASGVMADGFSFQTGAGGASLAVAAEIGAMMAARRVSGGFISGGITGAHVALARAGLFRDVLNVQSFDLAAVASFREDAWHRAMSAAEYASPIHPDPVCNRLDVMILGAAEIDSNFDVNVTTGSNGAIIGGPGGHPDTAAGAKLAVVTTRTSAGGFAKIVDNVRCVTTPGAHIDLLVTERGLTVNPLRHDLSERFRASGLPLISMDDLLQSAPSTLQPAPDVVRGVVEHRNGSILDVF